MKPQFQKQFIVLAWVASMVLASAQPTAFTYQGRLMDGGTSANGNYDFQLYLRDAAINGNPVSTTNTFAAVAVSNGLFTITLDFGATVFDGNPRWLGIGVRTNDSIVPFVTLNPRQQITSTPYAIFANTATNLAGTLPATQLTGAVVSAQLADSIELGAATANGRLDVFRTTAGTAAISLIGSGSQISTYGGDGLEQIRLWGPSYGELLLHNNLVNNAVAALLSAQGASGGELNLNNTNGTRRAVLTGANAGGILTLYQADGNLGAVLDGNDVSNAGMLNLRNTNGSARLTAYGGPASGSLDLHNAAGTITIHLDGGSGTVSTTSFYASGNIGIGTSSPQAPLEIHTPVNEPSTLVLTSGGSWPLALVQTPSSVMVISNGGVGRIFMSASGNVGIGTASPTHLLHVNGVARSTQSAWATSSDERVKRNVTTLDSSLAKVVSLRPVVFDYTPEYVAGRTGYEGRFTGFIAQEVEVVFPEMVQTVTEEVGNRKINDFRLLNSSAMTPHIVSAVRELNQKIDQKDAIIAQLNARLERLEKLLATMDPKN